MASTNQTTLGIIILASPIILVHGYSDDSSVWDSWVSWLKSDNITMVYPIAFKDECGTVADNAAELSNKINKILNDTGSEKVNIVAHSKGGLDARYYISNFDAEKVENLIMIGTPNEGTPAAYMEVTPCWFQGSAGREDLLPGSNPTQSPDQDDTNYYTVAGNYGVPCFITLERWTCYITENDGFVTVDSAKSHYTSLGTFPYNHEQLLEQKDIYQKILPIVFRER